jgi:hypothetical protein
MYIYIYIYIYTGIYQIQEAPLEEVMSSRSFL